MKTFVCCLMVAICTFAGAARAETFYVDLFEARTVSTTPALTRPNTDAHSRADEHMRRLSGLSRLSIHQRAEKSGFAYSQAKARYDQLVLSAQFGLLVAALERNPHLEVVGR